MLRRMMEPAENNVHPVRKVTPRERLCGRIVGAARIKEESRSGNGGGQFRLDLLALGIIGLRLFP
jgi:hypothetical protein